MIKDVKNVSRKEFRRINFYPTTENPTKQSHVYISIYGTDGYESRKPEIKKDLWYSGLQLKFDDVEDTKYKLKSEIIFSSCQATEVIRFLKEINLAPYDLTLIVHCFAGVSRSAAIGKFVNQVFKLNLEQYNKLTFFNTTVYRKLIEAWNKEGQKELIDFIDQKLMLDSGEEFE